MIDPWITWEEAQPQDSLIEGFLVPEFLFPSLVEHSQDLLTFKSCCKTLLLFLAFPEEAMEADWGTMELSAGVLFQMLNY